MLWALWIVLLMREMCHICFVFESNVENDACVLWNHTNLSNMFWCIEFVLTNSNYVIPTNWRRKRNVSITNARSQPMKSIQNLGKFFFLHSVLNCECIWFEAEMQQQWKHVGILIQIRVWIAFHRHRKLEFIRKTERLFKFACCVCEHPRRLFYDEYIFEWKLQIICLWCHNNDYNNTV